MTPKEKHILTNEEITSAEETLDNIFRVTYPGEINELATLVAKGKKGRRVRFSCSSISALPFGHGKTEVVSGALVHQQKSGHAATPLYTSGSVVWTAIRGTGWQLDLTELQGL
ncbi:hypothetical protein E1B28_005226 [Marasmius oreades]|uniref:Uncharacterized protein n=1 Tax=Marasmius oreades TaxID=181124 RepID=A0A9P7V062_9AGAR|nr:uncharacterized protein E1B28_005226 [Marasmius oreades]KAG7097915.1 hypothetical protein E1B28_005226 [Marasmius oreades]